MAESELGELGRALRRRREALDLTREELSRRVGVTPAYIFMVERARPRRSGTPSRPKRDTLKTWTEALGMSRRDANRVLRLAGYHPIDRDLEQHLQAMRSEGPAELAQRGMMSAAAGQFAGPPVQTAEPARAALMRRLEAMLDSAERRGNLTEAIWALTRAIDRARTELEAEE